MATYFENSEIEEWVIKFLNRKNSEAHISRYIYEFQDHIGIANSFIDLLDKLNVTTERND